MHARITVDTNGFYADETIDRWIFDIDALENWLDEHPQAIAEINRWELNILSPNRSDMAGLDEDECPAGHNAAVEQFDVWTEQRNGVDLFCAGWLWF